LRTPRSYDAYAPLPSRKAIDQNPNSIPRPIAVAPIPIAVAENREKGQFINTEMHSQGAWFPQGWPPRTPGEAGDVGSCVAVLRQTYRIVNKHC
jgi:hypothetical protein